MPGCISEQLPNFQEQVNGCGRVSVPATVTVSDSRDNAYVKLQIITLADGQSENKICYYC